MFYKYNRLTQSLVSTTQDAATGRALNPEVFKTVLTDSSEIHYEYKPLQAPEIAPRHAGSHLESSAFPVPNTPKYRRLMRLQSKFLTPDGRLVWQKLPADRTLNALSLGLVLLAAVVAVNGLKVLVMPPKNQ